MLSQSGRSKKDTPMYLFIWLRRSIYPSQARPGNPRHLLPQPPLPHLSFWESPIPLSADDYLISALFRISRPHTAMSRKIYKIKKKRKTIGFKKQMLWRSALLPFPCYFDTRVSSVAKENTHVDHVLAGRGPLMSAGQLIGIPSPPSASRTRLPMSVAPPRSRTPSSAISMARMSHRPFHGRGRIPWTYAATSISATPAGSDKTPSTRSVSPHTQQLHDVPLGSLPSWLRCSSSHSLSRHTPPPGTS